MEMTKTFAKNFEKYYNDNFGLRSQLINWGSLVKLKVFNSPINNDNVIVGDNNWIFYNGADGKDAIYDSYTHRDKLNEEDLEEYCQKLIDKFETNKRAGIVYIPGFWPQTHTIYPELLPQKMKMQIRGSTSKADQIIEYLKRTNAAVQFFDVRQALLSKKKERRLYLKLDSHWNELGAFYAYESFLNQRFEQLQVVPKKITDFEITWNETTNGDLVNLLGVTTTTAFKDTIPTFTYRHDDIKVEYLSTDGYPEETIITRCETCTNKKRVLVFRDSYSSAVQRFLSLHFYDITFLWKKYNQKYVDEYKPDIIIDVRVERYL
ncbi:DHHW family protein [Pseudochryseolinea flava]|nr:DHHW family protein [Pseudochryseolinea flava]